MQRQSNRKRFILTSPAKAERFGYSFWAQTL
jgi:hypothetical protein